MESAVYTILDQQRLWPIRARNIFAIRIKPLQDQLKDELYAESITVDKKVPNILRLKVTERQSSVIVISHGTAFEVDRHGVVTRILSDDESRTVQAASSSPNHGPPLVPVLSIQSTSGTPSDSNEFVTEGQMQRWLDTFDGLRKRGFGYRGAFIESSSSTKIILDLFEPYHVYFDLLTPIDAQIDSYYAFIESKKSDMAIHEYIDARIPGRIYYK